MRNQHTASPRAIALLLAAVALPAIPALAQEPAPVVTQQAVPVVAPPVVRITPPVVVRTTPDVAPAPVVATPAVETAAEPAPRVVKPRATAQRRVANPNPVRAVTPVATAETPVSEPVAEIPPVIEPVAVSPLPDVATVPDQTPPVVENSQGTSLLPIALGVLALLGIVAAFLLMRRRKAHRDDYADANYLEESVAEAAPVAPIRSAPVQPAAIQPAFAASLAPAPLAPTPLVPAPMPVSAVEETPVVADESTERPWVELSLQPSVAGTRDGEVVVEFALMVGNGGIVPARDVRISTWMFDGAAQGEMDHILIDPPHGSHLADVTVAPGSDQTIDGALALPRSGRQGFLPVIVADARYPLPDGGEGRMSASFAVGMPERGGEAIAPLPADDQAMHADVEARLHGQTAWA